MGQEETVLDFITRKLHERQNIGFKKYGVSIDECNPPTGSFKMEVIEELLDALQYITRECFKLQQEIKKLKEKE